MNCLNCEHRATGKMIRRRTVVLNGKKYNLYICNVCGNEAYINADREP
jgi:protein-arginine kinase activator protein McsA